MMGLAEYCGDLPLRQDTTVIPPSDPKKLRLGWTIREYAGPEVYSLTEFFRNGGSIGEVRDLSSFGWDSDWEIKLVDGGLEITYLLPGIATGKVSIPVAKVISVGDILIIPGLSYSKARVTQLTHDQAEAESDRCLFPLEFGKDDRECWVCSCIINKRVLDGGAKLFLDTEERIVDSV